MGSNQESNRSTVNIPRVIRSFIFCYIGGYGLVNATSNMGNGYIFIQIIATVICSFVFAYGFISIKDDFQKGGFKKIFKKMKSRNHDD